MIDHLSTIRVNMFSCCKNLKRINIMFIMFEKVRPILFSSLHQILFQELRTQNEHPINIDLLRILKQTLDLFYRHYYEATIFHNTILKAVIHKRETNLIFLG